MTDYVPPLDDYGFMIKHAGLGAALKKIKGCEEFDADDLVELLNQAGKFASEVIAPTNIDGDQQGAMLENGVVRLPESMMAAFKQFRDAGWTGLSLDPDYGGQGLPWTLAAAVQEMLQSANLAFALNPLLTIGAAEAIAHHGSDFQKSTYLEKLVTGAWSGTMNLTEPQAGSDLGKIKTKAVFSHADDTGQYYHIRGQKIYITYGDHEAYDNIIHLVLARIEGAPAGTNGISLFIVPKYLVEADGSLGARNDLKPIALESKLGIHGSPTCVMAYGEDKGALGSLVGSEHQGLPLMFTMMNLARLMVGVQGLGIAERAYQNANNYAHDRKQGKRGQDDSVPIIQHPDVRRMMMDMQANIHAMRALLMDVMLAFDTSNHTESDEWRVFAARRVDLMVPVVKSFFTDKGVEIASTALQVHGGAGFIEGAGAAQYYRDARILPIYEGTNGIQAMDLLGRKIIKDKGAAIYEYIEEANSLINRLNDEVGGDIAIIRKHLANAIDALTNGAEHILFLSAEKQQGNADRLAALATDFNHLFGIVAGGISLTSQLLNAKMSNQGDAGNGGDGGARMLAEKQRITRYYAETALQLVPALEQKIYHAPNMIATS